MPALVQAHERAVALTQSFRRSRLVQIIQLGFTDCVITLRAWGRGGLPWKVGPALNALRVWR
jgi:hypothetical protein